METRYIWYELTENYCSSEELSEVVIELRVVMNALLSQMNEIKRMNASIDTFSPAFLDQQLKIMSILWCCNWSRTIGYNFESIDILRC